MMCGLAHKCFIKKLPVTKIHDGNQHNNGNNFQSMHVLCRYNTNIYVVLRNHYVAIIKYKYTNNAESLYYS